ncbi:MAG: DUF1501 domain-containing protein [Isosphaeraceae bacterium]|nr:DUF1501 domain-containing protein [Isosphaeraceae bacterium]
MRVGSLGVTGLTIPSLLGARVLGASRTEGAVSGFGKARSCILIFMWGGPSQLDTWDPKPEAPVEIRGSFGSIATKVPGVRISEHFPMLAGIADRLAIVRSMTHDDPAHLSSAHRILTGHLAPTPFSDAAGPSPRDWPHLGAFVSRLLPNSGEMPAAVTMPWTVAHPAAPGGRAPGQHAGWLGKQHEPFAVEGDPNHPAFQVQGTGLPEGLTSGRFEQRTKLLDCLEAEWAASTSVDGWASFQSKAIQTLRSPRANAAFQLDREDPKTRDRYGRHIHGQCLLLARRLVEAGVPLVTVNWHNDGQNFWDTHGDNFNQLKNRLMPPADQGFSALIQDLEQRGMLEETLLVWVGEFGRTPRTTQGGSGREHWPRCYSAVLAGGGVRGGAVFGSSDRWAAYPSRNPVSPDDLGATILHALGIDPAREVPDSLGRPLRINSGNPIVPLFS